MPRRDENDDQGHHGDELSGKRVALRSVVFLAFVGAALYANYHYLMEPYIKEQRAAAAAGITLPKPTKLTMAFEGACGNLSQETEIKLNGATAIFSIPPGCKPGPALPDNSTPKP